LTVTLDVDWFYRRLGPALAHRAEQGIHVSRDLGTALIVGSFRRAVIPFIDLHRPNALFARTWSTSGMALGVMVILLAYLLGYYVL